MNNNLIIVWVGICMGMQWYYCNGIVILRVRKGITTNESNIKKTRKEIIYWYVTRKKGGMEIKRLTMCVICLCYQLLNMNQSSNTVNGCG